MGHPDEEEWRQEAAMDEWFDDQLEAQSRQPVFAFLARFGDSIQERVDACINDATRLRAAGFPGAALERAAAGIEITIRFFLAKPLVLGAFLSDEWAEALTKRLIGPRTAEDRGLLPAILRNWSIDLMTLHLSDGSQMWEVVVKRVWDHRNNYVHAAATITDEEASVAIECLEQLLSQVVAPMAHELGFTRDETNRWSVVLSRYDRSLNPPQKYETASPFPDAA
jgi:hypothetical protein